MHDAGRHILFSICCLLTLELVKSQAAAEHIAQLQMQVLDADFTVTELRNEATEAAARHVVELTEAAAKAEADKAASTAKVEQREATAKEELEGRLAGLFDSLSITLSIMLSITLTF